MPHPVNRRVRLFPDVEAAKREIGTRNPPRASFKVVPDRIGDHGYALRSDTYRGRAVFSTYLCRDGRWRYEDNCTLS
ncbi:MAG: hypothetical protein OXC11_16590 [Rhodospirillales bacterium]|nr:hypothetical protein [Rhodospirillales bacterium]